MRAPFAASRYRLHSTADLGLSHSRPCSVSCNVWSSAEWLQERRLKNVSCNACLRGREKPVSAGLFREIYAKSLVYKVRKVTTLSYKYRKPVAKSHIPRRRSAVSTCRQRHTEQCESWIHSAWLAQLPGPPLLPRIGRFHLNSISFEIWNWQPTSQAGAVYLMKSQRDEKRGI